MQRPPLEDTCRPGNTRNWVTHPGKRAGTAPIYPFQKNPRLQQKAMPTMDSKSKPVSHTQTPQQAVKHDIKQISKIYSCNSVKLKEKLVLQQQLAQKQRMQLSSRPQTFNSSELESNCLNPAKQCQLNNMMNYLNQGRQFYWSNHKKACLQSPQQHHNIFSKQLKAKPAQRSFSRNLVRTNVSLKKEDQPLPATKTICDDKKDNFHFSPGIMTSPPPQHFTLQHQKEQIKQYQLHQDAPQSAFGSNRPQSSIGRRVKRERENSTLEQSQSKQEKFYSLVQEVGSGEAGGQQQFQGEQQQFQGEQQYQQHSHSRRNNYNRPPSQVGIRRKDYTQLSNTNQEVFFGSMLHNDSQFNPEYSKRPQSRQKTPQKALQLELEDQEDNMAIPVQSMFQDIPIKSMYEDSPCLTGMQIPVKNMYENSFQDIEDEEQLGFSCDSQEEIGIVKQENQSVQSIDMENTYKMIDKQMVDQHGNKTIHYYPHSNNTITTKLDGSNIVVKHVLKSNNQSRNQANLSIPFETSLGTDFLSLFANTKESSHPN